jgi:hypothetical protein
MPNIGAPVMRALILDDRERMRVVGALIEQPPSHVGVQVVTRPVHRADTVLVGVAQARDDGVVLAHAAPTVQPDPEERALDRGGHADDAQEEQRPHDEAAVIHELQEVRSRSHGARHHRDTVPLHSPSDHDDAAGCV